MQVSNNDLLEFTSIWTLVSEDTYHHNTVISNSTYFNPLSAMVDIWKHVIVSFNDLAPKGFIGTLSYWVKCISKRLTVVKSVF